VMELFVWRSDLSVWLVLKVFLVLVEVTFRPPLVGMVEEALSDV
jgi:hypothetical protein